MSHSNDGQSSAVEMLITVDLPCLFTPDNHHALPWKLGHNKLAEWLIYVQSSEYLQMNTVNLSMSLLEGHLNCSFIYAV